MGKLAINGGESIRTKLFPSQNTFDGNEVAAATTAVISGRLSHYRANWTSDFYGGPRVRQLEKTWSDKFGSAHCIAVNSATNGLIIACGAIGLEPGDEVIVTPYSMTCSATAPLIYGAIPVFADVDPETFCLDPNSVKEKMTRKTKAIIAVSLFGQPYDKDIDQIAKEYGVYVIEDAAQAPGATRGDGKLTGNLGDIGVFSFNYGKHINSGEGGMITTNNAGLSQKCRLLMNNAESVINDFANPEVVGTGAFENMVGFNSRMTELTAAVAIAQLEKFDTLLEKRLNNCKLLDEMLTNIEAIHQPEPRGNNTHTYYVLPYLWIDKDIPRDKYINAVKAELMPREDRDTEGVPIGCGYIKPIYLMPLFKYQAHWALKDAHQLYHKGLCPVAEDLWESKLFLTLLHAPNSTTSDMEDVADAFIKVWEYKETL